MLKSDEGWKFLKTDKRSKGVLLASRVRNEGDEPGLIPQGGRGEHSVAIQWIGLGDLDVDLEAKVNEASNSMPATTPPSATVLNGSGHPAHDVVRLAYDSADGPDTWPIRIAALVSDDHDEVAKSKWLYHPDEECAPGNTHLVSIDANFKPVARGSRPFSCTLQLVVECAKGHEREVVGATH